MGILLLLTEGGIHLTFEEDTDAESGILIGADGIHSAVRYRLSLAEFSLKIKPQSIGEW
jgi:2-polyprenyl-6-methoxyphenol hydroxylase-like FAD-dependent oxidoreductase